MFREVEALFHIRKDIVHVSVRNNKLFSQTRLSVGVVSSTDKIPENYIIKAIVLDKEFANHGLHSL